jgi:hypothetical protein
MDPHNTETTMRTFMKCAIALVLLLNGALSFCGHATAEDNSKTLAGDTNDDGQWDFWVLGPPHGIGLHGSGAPINHDVMVKNYGQNRERYKRAVTMVCGDDNFCFIHFFASAEDKDAYYPSP